MTKTTITKRLKALMGKKGNQICCDCLSKKPTWAALIAIPDGAPNEGTRMGAFLCFQCSAAHRALGTHISFVRSVNLDDWKEGEVKAMEKWGNTRVNKLFEARLLNNFEKVQGDAKLESSVRLDFIRRKYEEKEFYDVKAFESLVGISSPVSTVDAATKQRRKLLSRINSMPHLMSPKWDPAQGPNQTKARIGELPRISPSTLGNNEMMLEEIFDDFAQEDISKTKKKSLSKAVDDVLGESFHFTSTTAQQFSGISECKGRSKRSRGKRKSKENLSESCHFPVNMNYSMYSKEQSPDSLGGGLKSSRKEKEKTKEELQVPDLSPPLLSGHPEGAAEQDRANQFEKKRPSLEDSLRELVDVLEKEDKNYQLSRARSMRRLERRQSLTNIIEASSPSKCTESHEPQARSASSRGSFLDTLLSPDQERTNLNSRMSWNGGCYKTEQESEGLTEHTCMLSTNFESSASLARTPSKNGKLRRKLTRRSSMPSNFSADDCTHVTEATDMNSTMPTPKGNEGRLRRILARKLSAGAATTADDGTLVTEASDMNSTVGLNIDLSDDCTLATEHSDIQSTADMHQGSSTGRRRRAGRRNSLPSRSSYEPTVASEKSTPGQLSSFLGTLLRSKTKSMYQPSSVERAVFGDQPPRKPLRRNLSPHRQAVRCSS